MVFPALRGSMRGNKLRALAAVPPLEWALLTEEIVGDVVAALVTVANGSIFDLNCSQYYTTRNECNYLASRT
jgi:hypothetical protein